MEATEDRNQACKKAEINAKKILKNGDRVRCTKCPGRKRVFTFSHFDGCWMVSKSGINDYHPVNVDLLNGVAVDFQHEANNVLAVALTSPALEWQSDRGGRMNYPANFRGRVPLKVKVAKNVTPDLPFLKKELGVKDDTICLKDNEYYVWVNSYGAVSAILPNGERLGLLPSEFDVTEWHS